jgi:hypothetical protein
MKTSELFADLPWVRAGLVSTLTVLLLGAAVPWLTAQSSDFNAGTDTGWTRYSLPLYGAATFSFPPDDAGGKAYQIYAPATGDDSFGMRNARAGSFRADVTYTGRFSVGVDMLAWNAVWRQETGLLFYFSDIGLGTSDGYSATYSSGYHNLYISVITDESERTVGQFNGVTLDPTHRYRLVVSSHDGVTFLFQLLDKVDLNNSWISAICQDAGSTYTSGFCGLFVYEQTYPSATEGAEATFDNYVASVPAAGAMPATVTDVSPQPGATATAVYPTVTVAILDRDTAVDTGSIVLSVDDVVIPNASLTIDPQVHKPDNPGGAMEDFSGATVTYRLTNLFPWGSQHTNRIAFADSAGTRHTNTWVWMSAYPTLFASNSLPLGSLSVRGFDVRMAQSDNGSVNLDNTLERAEQQLAVPPAIPVDLTATSIVQLLRWDKTAAPTSVPGNVPGLCSGDYLNIAVESLAYLELTAGLHRFHINTDDRAGLYSGSNLADSNAVALWENPGNTADATFDFVVEADGLYPVRCLWEETGGSAHLALHSVSLGDGSEVLINDPANPPGVVRAWYPLVCRSAAAVTGPYTVETAAVNVLTAVDLAGRDCSPTVVGRMVTGGTFTIPVPGATRFYLLDGPRATTLTSFRRAGANLVIDYRVP